MGGSVRKKAYGVRVLAFPEQAIHVLLGSVPPALALEVVILHEPQKILALIAPVCGGGGPELLDIAHGNVVQGEVHVRLGGLM